LRNLTVIILFLSAATIATGAINTFGVVYYDGFPLPWFCDLGLILIWLRYRRELDFELRQNSQSEA
jgi:hypothetical protein